MAEEGNNMKVFWQACIAIAKGEAYIDPVLNTSAPEVKLTSVMEFLKKCWA
jgi:hypothetical protein